jgi:hypothetical protein
MRPPLAPARPAAWCRTKNDENATLRARIPPSVRVGGTSQRVAMGRNTHGNKKKRYALAAGADGEAPPVAAPAPAAADEAEDEELHGGADPAEAAAAAADTTPADAALINQSREARRSEKKEKRRLRLAAEAAVAAAAVAAGLEAPVRGCCGEAHAAAALTRAPSPPRAAERQGGAPRGAAPR